MDKQDTSHKAGGFPRTHCNDKSLQDHEKKPLSGPPKDKTVKAASVVTKEAKK